MLIAPVEMDFDRGDRGVALAEPHDRALAKLLLDLADGHVERLDAFLSFVDGHVRKGSFQDTD